MEHDPHRRMLITALAGLTLANVSWHRQPPETRTCRVKAVFWWRTFPAAEIHG